MSEIFKKWSGFINRKCCGKKASRQETGTPPANPSGDPIAVRVQKMRTDLIDASKDPKFRMEEIDRECIRLFIEQSSVKPRPDDVPELMELFVSCCFGYSVVKKSLVHAFNQSGMKGDYSLPKALAAMYQRNDFLKKENWNPDKLHAIGQSLFEQHLSKLGQFSTVKPFNRIIVGIIDCSTVMKHKLSKGMQSFYSELDKLSGLTPYQQWDYAEDFCRNIRQVGHNLIFDFLKDIGCKNFVKLDHHVVKMLPDLALTPGNTKRSFAEMIQLANKLGYSPLEFDHIIYQYHKHLRYL